MVGHDSLRAKRRFSESSARPTTCQTILIITSMTSAACTRVVLSSGCATDRFDSFPKTSIVRSISQCQLSPEAKWSVSGSIATSVIHPELLRLTHKATSTSFHLRCIGWWLNLKSPFFRGCEG